MELYAPLHCTAYTGPPLVAGLTLASVGMGGYNIYAQRMKDRGSNCSLVYMPSNDGTGFMLYYQPTGSCDTTASVQQMRDSLAGAVQAINSVKPGHAGCIGLDHGGRYHGYVAIGTDNLDGPGAVQNQCACGEQVSDGRAAYIRTEL